MFRNGIKDLSEPITRRLVLDQKIYDGDAELDIFLERRISKSTQKMIWEKSGGDGAR